MDVFLIDTGRGVAVAVLAMALARALAPGASRPWAMALLAAWWLVPALVLAHAWAVLPLPGLQGTPARHGLHLLLCALRLTPLALALVWCMPAAPWSAEALHLARQLGARRAANRLPHPAIAWWLQGPGRRWLVAGLLILPLALGEFELGSRLAVDAWAVRLFDAQAGGAPLADTLRRILPVVAVQVLAVVAAWRLVRARGEHHEVLPQQGRSLMWGVLVAGSLLMVGVPVAVLVGDGVHGLAAVMAAPGIASELGASLLFAVAGGTCAWLAAGAARGRGSQGVVGTLAAAGLCGGLALGLILLAILPAAILATPLPLVIALAVQALPFAWVLRHLAGEDVLGWAVARNLVRGDARQRDSAVSLHWRLVSGRRWWAWAALTWWCLWELAASAILHPVDMTPVLVLLYHFMHYGESAALTARLALAVALPLLLLAALHPLARWWCGREVLRA